MATGGEVRTVELVQAFLWTCDDCGRDNFERAITVSPESISPDNLPESVDPEILEQWTSAGGEGCFMMAPDRVKCSHCQAEFAAATD
jgi:hypothetical protein